MGVGQGVAEPHAFVIANTYTVGSAEGTGDAHSGEGEPSPLNMAVDLLSPGFARRPRPTTTMLSRRPPNRLVRLHLSQPIIPAFLHIDIPRHTLRIVAVCYPRHAHDST